MYAFDLLIRATVTGIGEVEEAPGSDFNHAIVVGRRPVRASLIGQADRPRPVRAFVGAERKGIVRPARSQRENASRQCRLWVLAVFVGSSLLTGRSSRSRTKTVASDNPIILAPSLLTPSRAHTFAALIKSYIIAHAAPRVIGSWEDTGV